MTWNPGADVVEVTRGPQQAGGAGGFYRAFGETLRGLRTTLGQLASPVTTVQYPEENAVVLASTKAHNAAPAQPTIDLTFERAHCIRILGEGTDRWAGYPEWHRRINT